LTSSPFIVSSEHEFLLGEGFNIIGEGTMVADQFACDLLFSHWLLF
jgi:hypothetical protein